MQSDAMAIIRRYAGKWVAWNRQQDRVISVGRTFEEAKQSAAAAGESSIILTRASPKGARRPHWLCAVAVFIAIEPGLTNGAQRPAPFDPQSCSQTHDLEQSSSVVDEDDAAR
jgi:hypothetical protein